MSFKLALTHSVYGRHPQSWWLEIPQGDFINQHHLSHQVNQSILNTALLIQLELSGNKKSIDLAFG